jgi:hypothetical protein
MTFRTGLFLTAHLVAATCVLGAGTASAADLRNDLGRFSVWLPDGWVIVQQGARMVGHNPGDTVQVVVGPLRDADADLVDEDVADFVDDEIDGMRVASDTNLQQAGFAARRLAGTGNDEGDDVVFHAMAIDPGGTAAVIEAVVYGETDAMGRPQLQAAVEQILTSLRPLR